MRKVHGIGTVKAKELHDKYGCRSIADLQELVKSSSHPFQEASQIGLKHFYDLQVAHLHKSHNTSIDLFPHPYSTL